MTHAVRMPDDTKGVSYSYVTEPERQVPLLLSADVVVVGGGTAGPVAAIAAARQGASVVLIERFGSLGGNMTLGLNTKPSGALLGGLPLEIWNLARSRGGAGQDYMAITKTGGVEIASPCDPEIMKMLLTKLCVDAGVQILFETVACEPVMDEQRVTGVIVDGKFGRKFVAAKVVIDCSADADVAARAGVPFVMGGEGQAQVTQPVSMYFTMNDVDILKLARWARTSDDIPARAIPDDDADLAFGLWLTGFNKTMAAFESETGNRLQRHNITLKTASGVMYVNGTRVLGVNVFSPAEFTAAVLECYRQIEAVAKALIDRVPGFEKARIGQVSPILGVRETRHILGEYVITGDDTLQGTSFADSIAADCSALDIHEPKGSDVDFQGLTPYEIPFRALLPLKIDQLLIAGRCISADHDAHARTRNMPACMATGQAAGIAAALAIKTGIRVRDVPAAEVQAVLRASGMPIYRAETQSRSREPMPA
jgi:hypothetical protein